MGKWYEVVSDENGNSVFKCKLCGYNVPNSKSNMYIMNDHLDKEHPNRLVNNDTDSETDSYGLSDDTDNLGTTDASSGNVEESEESDGSDDEGSEDGLQDNEKIKNRLNDKDNNGGIDYNNDFTNDKSVVDINYSFGNINANKQGTSIEDKIRVGGREVYEEELIKIVMNTIVELSKLFPKGTSQANIDVNYLRDYLYINREVIHNPERLGNILVKEFGYKQELVNRIVFRLATYIKKYSPLLNENQPLPSFNNGFLDNDININTNNPYEQSYYSNQDNFNPLYPKEQRRMPLRQQFNPYNTPMPPYPNPYNPYAPVYNPEVAMLKNEIDRLKQELRASSLQQMQSKPVESGNSLKEAIEIITAIKGVFGNNNSDNELKQEIKDLKDKLDNSLVEKYESKLKEYENKIEDLTNFVSSGQGRMDEQTAKILSALTNELHNLKGQFNAFTGSVTPASVALTSINKKYESFDKTLEKAVNLIETNMKLKNKIPDGYELVDAHNESDYSSLDPSFVQGIDATLNNTESLSQEPNGSTSESDTSEKKSKKKKKEIDALTTSSIS